MNDKEPLIFCHKKEGRIAVMQKGHCWSGIQEILRLGTIIKHSVDGQWMFAIEERLFITLLIDSYALIKIAEKLNELNKVQ